MNIFVVTGTHFSVPPTITSFHAAAPDADVAATELVNLLRADIDPQTLPPVDVSGWQLGLAEAQRRRLETHGIELPDLEPETLAVQAGFDVRVDRAEVPGLSPLIVDDRELSTVRAALRSYQRATPDAYLLSIATNDDRHEPMTMVEIDDLCERLNADPSVAQETNVIVEVQGGMVRDIVADRPIKLWVVDYDVESADPDDLVMFARADGDPVPATVNGWTVDSIRTDPDGIARLDEALGAGD